MQSLDVPNTLHRNLLSTNAIENSFRNTRNKLGRVISREIRQYDGTQKRDPKREVSLQYSIDESSILLSQFAASNTNTPSVNADNREQQMIIAEVLEGLPDGYRQVIMMRNLQGLSHAKIATEMDRSERAIRMLWLRALKQLRHEVLKRQ